MWPNVLFNVYFQVWMVSPSIWFHPQHYPCDWVPIQTRAILGTQASIPPTTISRSWQFNFLSQDTRHLDFKSIESAWFLLLILYIILALHLRFSGTLYVWLLDWEIHTKTQQKTLPILNFHKFSYLNKVDKSIWLVFGYSGIYIFKLSILFKHLVWLIHVRTDNPLSF